MKATKTIDLESARRRPWARPTPFRIERFGALWPLLILSISCQSPPDQRPIFVSSEAQRIHDESIVIDGHNDIPSFMLDLNFDLGMDGGAPGTRDATLYWVPSFEWVVRNRPITELRTDTDIRRLRLGGVDAVFFSIFPDASYAKTEGASRERSLAMIDVVLAQIANHSEALTLATRASEIRAAVANGKIAILMGLEGGHAIENDLETLREFFRLGVRYMTLTWNNANDWADSHAEHPNGGLTKFGREVVKEMNRLGMLIDVSHVSDETFFDTLATTIAPIIASHSSARSLIDQSRNMSDSMLRAVGENGGLVMVNSQDAFLDEQKTSQWAVAWQLIRHFGWPATPLSSYIDHIEHIAQIAGVDHVGIGSDFAGTFMHPAGFRNVADFPNITAALLDRGFGADEVSKILGGNFMRVFEAAERAEAEAKAPREHRLDFPPFP